MPGLAGALAALGLIAASLSVLGQTYSLPNVLVTTIGGGPITQCGPVAGYGDGNTLDFSQFNGPNASALDSLGNLYIADTGNNAVRIVSEAGNTAVSETSTVPLYAVSTYTNGSGRAVHTTNNAAAGVIGLAEDSADDLYVLDAAHGALTKWTPYFNLLERIVFTNTLSSTAPVATAIAISYDPSTNIFLAFTNGIIVRFNLTNATIPALFHSVGLTLGGNPSGSKGVPAIPGYPDVHYVVSNFNWKPTGLTLMPNGQLAVSDTLGNAIYLVNTNDNQVPQLYTGGAGNGVTTNTAGFTDGPPGFAQFNQPHGIAASSDGHIVVADTMNNVVRLIDTNTITTTLYGTSSFYWSPLCCSCSPSVYPGWSDGGVGNTFTNAESRQPVSVTIASNGVIFVTELYYDLLRQATGTALNPVFFTNLPVLQSPSISITNPISSSTFTTNSTIILQVSVSDPNLGGAVTNVEYFNNGVLLSLVSASPFSYTWNSPPIGTNLVTAEAFDNYGLIATSAPVTINVIQPEPPNVAITSPTNGAQVFNPTNLAVTVIATDPNPNGIVETISLYENGTNLLGQQPVISNAPVTFLWINPTPIGPDILTAVALDNFGLTAGSAPLTVNVSGLPPSTAPPPPPVFTPNFGYFPFCETIAVTEIASNEPIQLFYTTDGTTPTTNSLPVSNLSSNNGVFTGSIQWCDPLHDLSQLQIIAFNGVGASAAAFGQLAPTSQIGFARGATGGAGDTLVLPIVVDLQSNVSLASIQFRVEVTPIGGNPNPMTSLTLLSITTNDFIPLAGPGIGNAPVTFDTFPYSTNNGQGLLVSAAGGGSGFFVSRFAAVCLLAVQVPANCANGQQYQLSVLVPSGTSDAQQTPVSLATMPNQILTVATVRYFAGDSSPGNGYNAGEFGDGILTASDVNNAIYASLGIRVPYSFTDAYNDMDVYPETATEIGDKSITYLDWQHILLRSEGLETNNWVRFWTNGVRSHIPVAWAPGDPPVPVGVTPALVPFKLDERNADTPPLRKDVSNSPPGLVWFCPALVGAGTVTNLMPGNMYSLPIYEKTASGYGLGGLQFRAILTANGGAPAPGAIAFTPAAGIPASGLLAGLSPNDVVCTWNLGAFATPLQQSNLLGSITFQVPAAAQAGQSYSLHFSGVGGAADLNTEYQMESVPGTAWVMSSAQQPPQITSDEWRINFFGSYTNALAADTADADGDGSLNWQEYVAGTNPTNAASRLQFAGITAGVAPSAALTLSWLTAPGKTYLLQSSPALGGSNWSVINTSTGDGNVFEFSPPKPVNQGNYYRICVQP